ncbi:MAG: leucine-rich repeat protein [Bacteroidales bacterium]|nr:leucine-rich repeat protein [Bacteroidales bacterium]
MKKIVALAFVLLLAASSLLAQTTQIGKWEKDEFTTEWTERSWDFSEYIPSLIKKTGTYSIVFTYKSGGQKLVLSNAEIKADGVTVATFEEEKSAGYNPKTITYEFKLSSIPQTLTLTAQAYTSGGTNSNGVIELVVPIASNEIIDSVLYIAEGTTTIADKAYYGNTEIKKVVIPSTVTKIGLLAFHNCTSLEEIDIPASVKTIGNAAFQNDTSLTKVTLHEGLTEINLKNFKNTAISEITIPSSVQKIGDNVFDDCKNLTKIYVDKYSDAHACLSGDSRIVFTDNAPVRSREEWLTLAKSNILEDGVLYIAEGTTEIKGSAFISRTDIKKVVCPSTLKTINAYAFRYCTNLEEVYLADTKTLMGYVFNGCTSLKKIVVSDSLKAIGNNCIPPTSELIYPEGSWAQEWYEATYYLTVNDEEIPANKYKKKNYKRVTLGSNVKTIGENAFANMEYLEEVIGGNNVENIGNGAFSGCTRLSSYKLPSNVVVIGNNCFSGTNIPSFDIPETAYVVGTGAFSGSHATSVSFGTHITHIPENVCANCPDLKNVVIKSVDSISAKAFYNCPKLTSVTLNYGLVFIGREAFRKCTSLSTIKLPETIECIMAHAFAETNIKNINMPVNMLNVEANSFPEGVVPFDISYGLELKPLDLNITLPTHAMPEDKYIVKSMSARVINLDRVIMIKNYIDRDFMTVNIDFPQWDREYHFVLDILGAGADKYEVLTNASGWKYIRATISNVKADSLYKLVVRYKIMRTPTEYNGYLSQDFPAKYGPFEEFYTKPSGTVGGCVSDHPFFQNLAAEFKKDTMSPPELAKKAFIYPWQHLYFYTYCMTLGPIRALEIGEGDCTEFSALFITICRACGIPCRQLSVATYDMNVPRMIEKTNHSLAEVYLEPVGWFAVDANLGGGSLVGRHRFGHVTTIQLYLRPENVALSGSYGVWRASEGDLGDAYQLYNDNVRKKDAELVKNKTIPGLPSIKSYTDEEALNNLLSIKYVSPPAEDFTVKLTRLTPAESNGIFNTVLPTVFPTQVATWKPDEFTTSPSDTTWDFSNDVSKLIKAPGTYSIVFTYRTGKNMLVASNAIVEADGKEVFVDLDEKSAGKNSRTITYTFHLDSIPKTLKFSANVRTDGGNDSDGFITLETVSAENVPDNNEGNDKPDNHNKPDNHETTALQNNGSNMVEIYVQNKTIVVENASDEIFVYDSIGRLIARRDAWPRVSTININESGVYVIKIGNLTKKIFVD